MKDILKTIIILSALALISGILLGGVNSFTQVDPEEQIKAKLNLVYDNPSELVKVGLSGNPSIKPVTDPEITAQGRVLNAYKSPDGVYVLRALGKGGYGGDIRLLYAIQNDKILKIAVFRHSETPGLGSKGFEENYLKRFYNKNIDSIEKFTLGKSGGSEIQALTGATFTSNAIINATNVAIVWYNNNKEAGQ